MGALPPWRPFQLVVQIKRLLCISSLNIERDRWSESCKLTCERKSVQPRKRLMPEREKIPKFVIAFLMIIFDAWELSRTIFHWRGASLRVGVKSVSVLYFHAERSEKEWEMSICKVYIEHIVHMYVSLLYLFHPRDKKDFHRQQWNSSHLPTQTRKRDQLWLLHITTYQFEIETLWTLLFLQYRDLWDDEKHRNPVR